MMSRFTRRALASVLAAALTVIAVASPAAAITPPVDGGGWSKCVTQDTGYLPRGASVGTVWNGDLGGGWGWDGTLRWKMCIWNDGAGAHFAQVQLSADAEADYTYTRFYAVQIVIKLQRCVTSDYYTIGKSTETGLQTGKLSSGRYRFDSMVTPDSSQQSSQGFRVVITTNQAYVQDARQTFTPIALSTGGVFGNAEFSSGCLDV